MQTAFIRFGFRAHHGAMVAGLLATVLMGSGTPARAGDTILCAAGRPCIKHIFQEFEPSGRSNVRIGWTGDENYDAYNVRWSRPGKAETQLERGGGGGGNFMVKNAHANTVYVFKVQGCNKRTFQSSRCSPWEERSIRTRGPG